MRRDIFRQTMPAASAAAAVRSSVSFLTRTTQVSSSPALMSVGPTEKPASLSALAVA